MLNILEKLRRSDILATTKKLIPSFRETVEAMKEWLSGGSYDKFDSLSEKRRKAISKIPIEQYKETAKTVVRIVQGKPISVKPGLTEFDVEDSWPFFCYDKNGILIALAWLNKTGDVSRLSILDRADSKIWSKDELGQDFYAYELFKDESGAVHKQTFADADMASELMKIMFSSATVIDKTEPY